jgi:NADPH:quinone reductase
LIFGASGAVGTLAVQFARRRKARVLATASGRAAANLMRRLGAEEVIDARRKPERLREVAPDGIDAALVLAGGKNLEAILDAVRPGGRVAYPNGVEPEPRRRPRVGRHKYDAEVGPRQFAQLDRAVTEARLRVPIAAVFSLRHAARAHSRTEAGHVLGRVVLQVRKGAVSRSR